MEHHVRAYHSPADFYESEHEASSIQNLRISGLVEMGSIAGSSSDAQHGSAVKHIAKRGDTKKSTE